MDTIPVVVFPFDLFGNAGTGQGALLLADVLREAMDDTDREERLTRPASFAASLDLIEVNFDSMDHVRSWRVLGKELATEHRARSEFMLWLGGNHLSVFPLLETLSPTDLVLQLDAHLDCYDLADNTEELNHGNFLRELKPKKRPKIVHLGHRDLFLMEADYAKHVDEVLLIDRFALDFANVLAEVRTSCAGAKKVWLDLDVDALDPTFAPAVHSPSPCGLTPQQLLAILLQIPPEKFAGLSISEFDPGRDDRDRTLNLLGWFLERALLHRVSG